LGELGHLLRIDRTHLPHAGGRSKGNGAAGAAKGRESPVTHVTGHPHYSR
jgi:hypothetical protein